VAEEAAEMVAEVARVAEVAVAKQKLSEARRFGIAKDIFMFLIDCPENILHSETTAQAAIGLANIFVNEFGKTTEKGE
jgi:hypothetical protein